MIFLKVLSPLCLLFFDCPWVQCAKKVSSGGWDQKHNRRKMKCVCALISPCEGLFIVPIRSNMSERWSLWGALKICLKRFLRCHRYTLRVVARVTGFWPVEAGEGLTRVRAHLLLLTRQLWLSTLPLSLRCLQGCRVPCAAPLWALPPVRPCFPSIPSSLHPWHRILFSRVLLEFHCLAPDRCGSAQCRAGDVRGMGTTVLFSHLRWGGDQS